VPVKVGEDEELLEIAQRVLAATVPGECRYLEKPAEALTERIQSSGGSSAPQG
jgi:hypothetical protein